MFMLGQFTNGLFGGASHTYELANKYLDLRDTISRRNHADEVENAIQRGDQGGGSAGFGQPLGAADSSTGRDTTRPDYASFDDDPELSKLPKPARVREALKGITSSPLEGKGIYGRGQPGTPDSPREGKNYGTPPVDTGRFDWLNELGQKLRALGQGGGTQAPQQPQQPPAYLPPQKPPNVGPAGVGGGAGPGTLDTLQQHGALLAPGGVPYPNGPTLANQQDPRARILAAINPTTGPA